MSEIKFTKGDKVSEEDKCIPGRHSYVEIPTNGTYPTVGIYCTNCGDSKVVRRFAEGTK